MRMLTEHAHLSSVKILVQTNQKAELAADYFLIKKKKHKTQYNCEYCSGVHATFICTMNLELLGKQSA